MEFRFSNLNITDNDVEKRIDNKIKFNEFEKDKEYDITAEFFNRDLIDDSLNEEVSYELKRKHYQFIKAVRSVFEKNDIKVNVFRLMGTIVGMSDDELYISVKKSGDSKKSNIVWPCKEIFIYEDGKNKLDNLLFLNQISYEEYESNLEDLKYELSIYENDDEHEYLN